MPTQLVSTKRYEAVSQNKAEGATYTPKSLADFVAAQIISHARTCGPDQPLRILDPAVGDGELLLSLLQQLDNSTLQQVQVFGFDTNQSALQLAASRLRQFFPRVAIHFSHENFLEHVLQHFETDDVASFFKIAQPTPFDLIIANPPYVRTQIMGADQAQLLARQFGLSGRVDLYYAFLIGMAQVMHPGAVAGIIVSNRFMTTKSGSAVRHAIHDRFHIRHVWDLGDTKLFDAAVLPAVLLLEKRSSGHSKPARFTSIYETIDPAEQRATDVMTALSHVGAVEIDDGRRFIVKQGRLDHADETESVWRIATTETDSWLARVEAHTWGAFRDIGKVRVGVKTCADKVFIRSDWSDFPEQDQPELLRPLITHHVARRFRADSKTAKWMILYPHEIAEGNRRAVDIARYPKSQRYLEKHRSTLEDRKYVLEAGRQWYEIWVPQDPGRWAAPKLVFRDITEQPTFWIATEGGIVNGDCYWLACERQEDDDLLWLACAVANSTFIEEFYDHRFHNKLYSGRRRFITQYVEQFPLPDPRLPNSRRIVELTKRVFNVADTSDATALATELNTAVWSAFGLPLKKVTG